MFGFPESEKQVFIPAKAAIEQSRKNARSFIISMGLKTFRTKLRVKATFRNCCGRCKHTLALKSLDRNCDVDQRMLNRDDSATIDEYRAEKEHSYQS